MATITITSLYSFFMNLIVIGGSIVILQTPMDSIIQQQKYDNTILERNKIVGLFILWGIMSGIWIFTRIKEYQIKQTELDLKKLELKQKKDESNKNNTRTDRRD
jgi:hypothetical protein